MHLGSPRRRPTRIKSPRRCSRASRRRTTRRRSAPSVRHRSCGPIVIEQQWYEKGWVQISGATGVILVDRRHHPGRDARPPDQLRQRRHQGRANDPPRARRRSHRRAAVIHRSRCGFASPTGQEAACTNTSGQQVTTLQDVTMQCRAVVSIRIFAPSDPTSPYISVCKELSASAERVLDRRRRPAATGDSGQRADARGPDGGLSARTRSRPIRTPANCNVRPVSRSTRADFPSSRSSRACRATSQIAHRRRRSAASRSITRATRRRSSISAAPISRSSTTRRAPANRTVKVTAVVDDFDTDVSVQSSVADHLSRLDRRADRDDRER